MIDLQVEGSRIADELSHLRELVSDYDQPHRSYAAVLFIKILATLIGGCLSLFAGFSFDPQMAFISITLIAFISLAIVIGARKIAGILPANFLTDKREKSHDISNRIWRDTGPEAD